MNPRPSMHLRLPPDVNDWLGREADERGLSKTKVIELALRVFRDRGALTK